jgi:hypothetical protein
MRGVNFLLYNFTPKEFYSVRGALTNILQQAKHFNPPVWVATLREIAEWWKERATFTFEIEAERNGIYRVQVNCSERATILVKNCRADMPVSEWSNGYKNISGRKFVLESLKRPVIGVSLDSSPAAISFLQSEGFIVEWSDQPDNYGVYFNKLARFEESTRSRLARNLSAPMLPCSGTGDGRRKPRVLCR